MRTRLLLPATALAGALALAACGSSAPSDAAGTDDALAAYRQCMAENGVTLPEGPGGTPPSGMPSGGPGAGEEGQPGEPPEGAPSGMPSDRPSGEPPSGAPGGGAPAGVDSEAFAAAQQACADLAPEGLGGPAGAPGQGPGPDATGAPGATPSATASASTTGTSAASAVYLSCLADNGVTVTAEDLVGLDRADPAVSAALATCAPLAG
jgi:hypothetical protein